MVSAKVGTSVAVKTNCFAKVGLGFKVQAQATRLRYMILGGSWDKQRSESHVVCRSGCMV